MLPPQSEKGRQNRKRIIQCSNSKPVFLPQYTFSHTRQFRRQTPNLVVPFSQSLLEKCYFGRFLGEFIPKVFPLPSTVLPNHYSCGHSDTRSTAYLNHGNKWHHFLHVFLQFWQTAQFTGNDFVIRQFSIIVLKKQK